MEVLRQLEDLVESELKKLVKKEALTVVEIEAATKAVCLIEKIQKIQNGAEYNEGHSERRGRNPGNGRFMSMRRGYSGHSIKDRMVDRLESMMDEAHSDYEREAISEWIRKLEN